MGIFKLSYKISFMFIFLYIVYFLFSLYIEFINTKYYRRVSVVDNHDLCIHFVLSDKRFHDN